MPLRQLRATFEKRRSDLIDLLESNPKLDPAKQHQIYGAIIEIENFLKTIEHLREREIQEEKFHFELKNR